MTSLFEYYAFEKTNHACLYIKVLHRFNLELGSRSSVFWKRCHFKVASNADGKILGFRAGV